MNGKFPLMENVSVETLLEIAKRRFPEYKSYTQTFIIGKSVCINKNALFRAVILVKHNKKKNQTTLIVNSHVTWLGCLLAGPMWGGIIFKGFFDEVREVYNDELSKLAGLY